jgi:hypothetical protein
MKQMHSAGANVIASWHWCTRYFASFCCARGSRRRIKHLVLREAAAECMARRRTASQGTIRLGLELPNFLESLKCRFVQHPHYRNLLVFHAQTNRIHEVQKNLVANFDVVFPLTVAFASNA